MTHPHVFNTISKLYNNKFGKIYIYDLSAKEACEQRNYFDNLWHGLQACLKQMQK